MANGVSRKFLNRAFVYVRYGITYSANRERPLFIVKPRINTRVLAVFAVNLANAANIINSNWGEKEVLLMKYNLKSLLGVIFVVVAAVIMCSCTQINVPTDPVVIDEVQV
jgi:hypothetical protein